VRLINAELLQTKPFRRIAVITDKAFKKNGELVEKIGERLKKRSQALVRLAITR
jgi:hypothetical protein